MTVAKIHGAEFPVRKIFSNDFNFRIPKYQRPYSWTTEQAGELLADLLEFIGEDPKVSIDDLSPYFLGSIVLIKDEARPNAEVVDGQQRLTTLTILLSVLRHCIADKKYSSALRQYLYEEGNPLEGDLNRYRLMLRDRDAEFFRAHVQDAGQLPKLVALNEAQLGDSRRNIRANAVLFLDRLTSLSDEQRVRLARFIIQNCLLVVVSTPDLDSAYRIFSILNDRGLDLSHADILKSEIVGRIPSGEQEKYNEQWEDAEEDLGREAFSDLFAHTRMIFRKQKMRESILKEFREFVVKQVSDSKKLIDDVLIPFADALAVIKTSGYVSTGGAEKVNSLLRWLNRIDNTDWLPPAVSFLAKNRSDSASLQRFFSDLERLAAFMMVCRFGINERIERYGKVLTAIEDHVDLRGDDSPLQLRPEERQQFFDELNGDLYLQSAKRRLYVLLRLDSALSTGEATYDHGVLSIEHVLPQNPKENSLWQQWFSTQELRDRWVHRLGNLLLLNHSKNSSASNYEFDKKKTAYFAKGGVSPFPLTSQVISESEWTIPVVERRQQALLARLSSLWRLDGLSAPPDNGDKPEQGSSSKRDEFGCRIGSQAAKINAALTSEAMTAEMVAEKTSLPVRRVKDHIDSLIKKRFVKKVDGGFVLLDPTDGEPPKRRKDRTKFDVGIDGVVQPALPKRAAMLKLVKSLCERGATPEEIAACVPWRTTMICNTDGSLSAEEFAHRMADKIYSGGKLRYFCNDDQLIRTNGKTYAVSNGWGHRTFSAIQGILKRFPDKGVSCEKHHPQKTP